MTTRETKGKATKQNRKTVDTYTKEALMGRQKNGESLVIG
jgi:hypothetical protein